MQTKTTMKCMTIIYRDDLYWIVRSITKTLLILTQNPF